MKVHKDFYSHPVNQHECVDGVWAIINTNKLCIYYGFI
nr:MAG TPA: hypothetical protein [Caudoviricetes sp.]